MIKKINLNVDVKFSAFHEKTGRVLVKQIHKGGRQHFRVRLYIEGSDLEKVERVIYTLHPTFREPRREITAGPNFELVIWTWGLFNVGVEIYDKTEAVDERVVLLDYSQDIEAAKAQNLLFWANP